MADGVVKLKPTFKNKPLLYLKQEGHGSFFNKAIEKISSPLFKYKKTFIYVKTDNHLDEYIPEITPKFTELLINNIDALENIMYQGKAQIHKNFLKGDRCFVAYLNGEIIHYTWVSFKEGHIASIEKDIKLKESEAYIYNVRTLPDFRNKGIFLFVLGNVCKQLSKDGYKKLYTSILENNISSQKAFEKIGFKKSKEVRYFKIFGHKRYHYKELS
jgi:GNAT superfamily N-acetyltransferase